VIPGMSYCLRYSGHKVLRHIMKHLRQKAIL
jgi:hypothetical protein